jgi:hypothetical protein
MLWEEAKSIAAWASGGLLASDTTLLTVVNINRFSAAIGIGSAGFCEGMVCEAPDRPTNEPAPEATTAEAPGRGDRRPMPTSAIAIRPAARVPVRRRRPKNRV